MTTRKAIPRSALGIAGTLAIATIIITATRYSSLPFVQDGYVLKAQFAEAGGLNRDDPVIVSGAKVGKVESIDLDRGVVRVSMRVENGDVRLGSGTRAAIVTTTLLGQAGVKLAPHGTGRLTDGDLIPAERTSSPYDITNALSELTTETSDIDVDRLASSLTTLSRTFQDSPGDVRKALTGIDSLADAVNQNDEALQQLLARAGRVSGVLAKRDKQVKTLFKSGDRLLEQLNDRQEVLTNLLEDAIALSVQLTAISRENKRILGPALVQFNHVIAVLNDNKENLQKIIVRGRDYATTFGEAVTSGPYFDAYVQNLAAPGTVAPTLSELLK